MPFAKFGAIVRLLLQRRAVNGKSFNTDGFHSWSIGEIRATKVVEMEGEGFGEFLIPDAAKNALASVPWLHPDHVGERGGLRLSVHSFVVEIGGRTILVDTNVGNDKKRKVPIWNKMSMPWLEDLALAGFPQSKIDMVICTHLHIDHVGWNTRLVDGQWVPTFPNARYVFVKEEYDSWRGQCDDPARAELFADSITPIVEAGLVDWVTSDAEIVPGMTFVPTPGHTDHHVAIMLESNGEKALITGDFLHHPAQIAYPEWSSSFDTQPEQSVSTRLAMFEQLADDQTLILGTAFPDPSGGYIQRDGAEYRFETRP
ncbi:MAG: MBL fold metallo-hydrolase [Parasphingorhabdus sp.]